MTDSLEIAPTSTAHTPKIPTNKRRFRPRFNPAAKHSRATKLLTLLVLALPPILYLLTFALTLATISSPDYVRANRLTTGDPETSGLLTNHVQHASLFHNCPADVGNVTDPNFYNEHCSRRDALGSKGLASCRAEFFTVTRVCEKVVGAAELYVAGAVLSGFAFLAASLYTIFAAGTGMGPGHYESVLTAEEKHASADSAGEGVHHHHTASAGPAARGGPSPFHVLNRAFGSFATLLAIAASGCLVLGQILGVSALVIEASPSISDPLSDHTRWYMSKGALQFTSAAYALGFIGAFVAGSGCGLHHR